MRLTNTILGIVLLFITVSCSDGVVFEQIQTVDVEGWDYQKPVVVNFSTPDTSNRYNLIFDVRITHDYAFQNLWLFIETTEPDGSSHTDSISCPLAYPDGRWIGSGLGDLIDNPILVHRNFKFAEKGEYTFKIKHGMRNDYLPNVQNVGVILKQIK